MILLRRQAIQSHFVDAGRSRRRASSTPFLCRSVTRTVYNQSDTRCGRRLDASWARQRSIVDCAEGTLDQRVPRQDDPLALKDDTPSAPLVSSATTPAWIIAVSPAALLPGSLASSDTRWIFENFVGYGDITMGLQGIVSLGIFINPLFEAMPRIRKQGCVGRMPLLPYSAMAAQGMVWTCYGLLQGNPAIWTPNFVALLLGLYFWRTYRRYCPARADWLPFTEKSHVVGFLSVVGASAGAALVMPTAMASTIIGLLGNVMTLAMFGGPLAAMRTVIADKSTRPLNIGFACAVNVNCNLWFFYAFFYLNDPFIYIQDGLGLLLTTVQLALFLRYGIHR